MRTVTGKYVTINEHNVFFADITTFLINNFDTELFADAVIVLGSYLFRSIDELRRLHPGKRIIVFQLESMTSRNHQSPSHQFVIDRVRDADEVWEYDPANSAILAAAGIKNRVVPFTYTQALDVGLDKYECDVDLLFYGILNHRRVNILEPMQAQLYGRRSFLFAFGLCGDALDSYIRRSKIILNMHAFDNQAQEQVRILRPVCNGKMVLSEHSGYNHYGNSIVEFNSIESLVQKIDYYLDENRYKAFGANAREEFKRPRF